MSLSILLLLFSAMSCNIDAVGANASVGSNHTDSLNQRYLMLKKVINPYGSITILKGNVRQIFPQESNVILEEANNREYVYAPFDPQNNTDWLHDPSCPTWMYRFNDTSPCQCGSDLQGRIKCNKTLNVVSVLDCNCVTYDEEHKQSVAGKCFYGCRIGSLYEQLPLNINQVNSFVCGKLNRDGRLCGECKHGYFPVAYSYEFSCIDSKNCSILNNWFKFAAVVLVPSTVCFFLIITCKINALSPQLHGFVQISQAFAAAINLRMLLFVTDGYSLEITKIIALPYGAINFDFFRSFSNSICFNLTTLQVLALDYVTAIYPLLLALIAFILIQLHAKNCRLILWIWKPFRKVFSGDWDMHSSIIKAFATLLLLSYGKLLSVTFDLLIPTKLYNVTGGSLGFYLYYDASYKYFSHDHLPYACLALVISLTLLLPPPLLLLVYPMSWFQKCFNNRSPRLHTFVECFYGYYNDGTEPNTRDCRWIAALYFIGKIILVFIFYGLTRNVLCYFFLVISMTLFAIVIIVVKPYKARYSVYNKVDATLILLIAVWCASVSSVNEALIRAKGLAQFAIAMSAFIPLVPLVYISFIMIKWIRETYLKKFAR